MLYFSKSIGLKPSFNRLAYCSLFFLALFFTSLHAQNWPSKPVKIVVTLSAGSTSDILARIIGDQLTKSLGQPFVVENRPGAGGNVAGEYTSHQAPDGYTIMLASISSHGINPALYAKMPYDAIHDFTPIIAIASSPNVLIASNETPVSSVKDLITWIKSKPTDTINYSSAGNGTSMHLSGELFNSMAGLKTLHVPFKGSPEAINSVMKNEVSFMFPNAPNAIPLAKGGKIKMLAVTSAKRLSWLPDLPTVAESGLPGFEVTAWFGFVGPQGIPTPIVNKLNSEVQKVLQLPSVNEALVDQGFEPMGGSATEFSQFMKSEIDKWSKVIKQSSIPKL
jgi:tripartite-type tricarboxylate transporter receptor subunit TctC